MNEPRVSMEPIRWRNGDEFTLTLDIHVYLTGRPINWPKVEGECYDLMRTRLREARQALHEGRPR